MLQLILLAKVKEPNINIKKTLQLQIHYRHYKSYLKIRNIIYTVVTLIQTGL